MLPQLMILTILLTPTLALAGPRAAVTVAGQGVDGASLPTIKILVEDALAKRGVQVVRHPVLAATATPAERAAFASQHRLARIYEAKLLPIGRKLLVRLGERAGGGRVTHSAVLSASSLEELDVIVPRLVQAVVERVAVAQTQRVDNVSDSEGRVHRKRSGELLFGGALITGSAVSSSMGGPLYGFEANFAYEMPHVRLNLDVGGAFSEDVPGHMFTAVRAFYLFSSGNISPFVGGGMGLMVAFDQYADGTRWEDKAGMALTASAGVELFRLHRARLIAEVEGRFPLFTQERRLDTGGANDERHDDWAPIGLFKLTLVFGRRSKG